MVSFLWVLTIKFIMALDLKIRFSSNFLLSFWWMQMCFATLRPLKFFKRKKRKKESHSSKWKVSKKQVFQKKYYPIRDLNRQRLIRMNIFWNFLGGDFFWNPQGLNLLFWIPGTYLCFLFLFIFFLKLPIKYLFLIGFYLKEWELIWKIDVFGKGIKFFGCMNKPNQKIKKLFIRPKKLILFLFVLIFEDAWRSVGSRSIQFAEKCLLKMGSIFKKQCIILPSAMWQ